jgi:hypothetical protein
VIDAEFECAVDRGCEIGLALRGNVFRVGILPRVLVAHATARDDRHLQIRAAKSPVFHDHTV